MWKVNRIWNARRCIYDAFAVGPRETHQDACCGEREPGGEADPRPSRRERPPEADARVHVRIAERTGAPRAAAAGAVRFRFRSVTAFAII